MNSDKHPAFLTIVSLALVASVSAGCVKKMVLGAVGNSLGSGTSTFATDDDPELVGDALPFALKTIEGLLGSDPEHEALLQAATSGFTQYAKAYVEYEADYVEKEDFREATRMRERARRLYVRARDYGLRGLEVRHPGFKQTLLKDPKSALAETTAEDCELLYYTAGAWASAISLNKTDADLAVDLELTGAMMKRVLELDPDYGDGAAHDFFIAYEASRPAAAGGSVEAARRHLEKALEISNDQRVAPLVAFAHSASVSQQDRAEFEKLLKKALAFDADEAPEHRLANLIAQKRARWLLGKTNELFLE